MRKLRRRDRLAHEAPLRLLVRSGKDFQRHLPLQTGIFGQVDLTHAAAAELTQDPVTSNLLGDHLYVDMMHRIQQRRDDVPSQLRDFCRITPSAGEG